VCGKGYSKYGETGPPSTVCLSLCRLLTTLVDKVVSADGTELLRSYIEVGGDGMPNKGYSSLGGGITEENSPTMYTELLL